MEATATAAATGSQTIAELIDAVGAEHGEHAAVRYKRDGAWQDVTYAQLAEIVQEIALGLIDLGIQPGERVCILANTRPEWTYVDLAATSAGAVVVPIYQTNSPEECLWVISDSDASAIVCEDAEQLAKIAAIRDQVPNLRTVIVIDPPRRRRRRLAGRSRSMRCASAGHPHRGGARSAPRGGRARRTRSRSSTPPAPPDRPKGCVLTHGNYRAIIDMIAENGEIAEDEVVYLYLPLAHSFALLIQLAVFNLGVDARLLRGRRQADRGELMEVKPTYLPSVPRVFEKVYTLARGAIDAQPPEEQEQAQRAIELGVQVRDLMNQGRSRSRRSCRSRSMRPRRSCSRTCARSSAAACARRPAAPRRSPARSSNSSGPAACPVFEGYGMTETATAATVSTLEDHRFGTVGRPLPGVEVRIAEDGEILVKGPNIFAGYHHHDDAASARSSTGGCTPATSARSTRTATSRSPGARRTSSSPRAARTSRRRTSRTN